MTERAPAAHRGFAAVLRRAPEFLAAAPAAAVAIAALFHPFHPSGDWAGIESLTARVFSRAIPLTGVYSRYGFDHPGPLGLYLLAIPYRIAPRAVGVWFGAALWNAVWAAVIVVLARRRAGVAGAWIAAGAIALYCATLHVGALADPWNPMFGLLPLGVVLMAAWVWVGGEDWALVAMVAAGSVAVQSHLLYALPVAALGIAALLLRATARRSPDRGDSSEPREAPASRGAPRWWAAAAAAALLLWMPPLLQQGFGHGPGNLGRVVSEVLHPRDEPGLLRDQRGRLPLGTAAHIVAHPLAPPFVWLSGLDRGSPRQLRLAASASVAWPLATAAAAVAAWLLARRRAQYATVELLMLGCVGCAAAVVVAVIARGRPYEEITLWARVPSLALWSAIAAVLVPPVRAVKRAGLFSVALLAGFACAGRLVVRPQSENDRVYRTIEPAVVKAFRGSRGVDAPIWLGGYVFGVRVLLDRAGIAWTATDRPRRGIHVDATMLVVVGHDLTKDLHLQPGQSLVAYYRAGDQHDPGLPPDFELAVFRTSSTGRRGA